MMAVCASWLHKRNVDAKIEVHENFGDTVIYFLGVFLLFFYDFFSSEMGGRPNVRGAEGPL